MLATLIFDYDIITDIGELEDCIKLINIELQNPVMLEISGIGHSLIDENENLIVSMIINFANINLISQVELIKKKRYFIIKII